MDPPHAKFPTMFGSLPNTVGAFYTIAGALSNITAPSGPFLTVSNTSDKAGAVWFDQGSSGEQKQSFDLSSENSVYAEGATVQSSALQVLACIKA